MHGILKRKHWLAVVDEIRQGRCQVEDLILQMRTGFTDKAGVAWEEALTVNTTLRRITLLSDSDDEPNAAVLGVLAYEAFSAMLRVNTGLNLKFPIVKHATANERLFDYRKRLNIEQRLNKVGRGRLMASRQTTREE